LAWVTAERWMPRAPASWFCERMRAPFLTRRMKASKFRRSWPFETILFRIEFLIGLSRRRLDQEGNLVNITIEHAKAKAGLREFSYQEVVSPFEEKAEQVGAVDA